MKSKTYYRTLTIAGSDSCGGAGIQADLKTFSALGCYGMSVITALTAQNTLAVKSVFEVSAEFIGEQLDAVFDDMGVDAVKIGMLHRTDIIRTVANRLKAYNITNLVIDPVMISKSGHALIQPEAVCALKDELFPIATIITPNLPEAEILLQRQIVSATEIEKAAYELGKLGSAAVLIKGGHGANDSCNDFLWLKYGDSFQGHWLSAKRIDTKNTHGTRCTLSSAIAAFLARGLTKLDAVNKAKAYLTRAIEVGAVYRIGRGHGPVHHFHGLRHDSI